MIHCGGTEVTKGDLDLIPLPDATDSYVPVSHYHLADRLTTISRDILTDYAMVGEQYALARSGQQMFALLKFQKDNSEMGLSIAFRNSYDRSMSIGLAMGANVFVCDNLALTGEIAVMKKHTKNVWTTLEDMAIANIYKSQHNFQKIITDSEKLKGIPFDNMAAFGVMGVLFGLEIISPRQLTVVRDEWLKPRHDAFQPRNAWSMYNCCTEAMKTCPPIAAMEKHLLLHKQMEIIIQ
jgi:hypothetical protein